MNLFPLIDYFLSNGADENGRLLLQVVGKSDDWLESTHDYIQWLFPLAEKSGANPTAPLIEVNLVSLFQFNTTAQKNYLLGLDRMLSFYGLERHERTITKGKNWNYQKGHWFIAPTHNDLRITRMLKSMSILGFGEYARSFLEELLRLSKEPDCGFSDDAIGFWKSAVQAKWTPKEVTINATEFSESSKADLQRSVQTLLDKVRNLSASDAIDENERFRWEQIRHSVALIAVQTGVIGKSEYAEEHRKWMGKFSSAIGGVPGKIKLSS